MRRCREGKIDYTGSTVGCVLDLLNYPPNKCVFVVSNYSGIVAVKIGVPHHSRHALLVVSPRREDG
jgi:hypothetical protein